MAFQDNVFINCPFDKEYSHLLRPLLFTVVYLKLKPRIALERLDSGEVRLHKIIELIRDSKYAIHDLSRMESEKAGELFRLNMPFELGLDVGCRLYGQGHWANKKCLILEAKEHRYKAAISDLSNSDIAVHENDPVELVAQVRNWLSGQCKIKSAGPNKIWDSFNFFASENNRMLMDRGFSETDIEKLPVSELIDCMEAWVKENV